MAEILTQAAAALQTALDSALTNKLLVVATGSAVSLPPSLTDPAKPLVVSGSIVPNPATNGINTTTGQPQISVQTSAGQVVIALDTPLAQTPRGTVAIAIQPGDPPTAAILAPQAQQTAQTAQSPESVNASQSALNMTAQTVAQAAPLPPLAIGQVVAATVLTTQDRPQAEETRASGTGVAPIVPVAAAGSGAQAKGSPDIILPNAVAPAQAGSSGSGLIDRRLASGQLAPPDPEEPEDNAGEATDDTSSPALPPSTPLLQTGPSTLFQATQAAAEDNLAAPAPAAAQAVPYGGAQPLQAAPATQRFVILSIVAPDETGAELSGLAPAISRAATPPGAAEPVETTVVAQTLSGQPVLAARTQTLVMTEPAAVQLGSQVMLRPMPATASGASELEPAVIAAPYNPVPLAAGGRVEWPALAQLVSLLPNAQPQAMKALSDILPRVNGDFVQRFVAFAGSPRPGVPPPAPGASPAPLRIAEGSVAPALARTLTGLLSQLHQDLTVSAHAGAPAKPGQWQSLSVPVMSGERLDAIQMFVRRQPDPDETDQDGGDGKPEARRSSSTRFLVEVSPSRLGPVQLDGLLRTQRDTTLRLDMVVRPAAPLTDQQGQDIDGLFQTALNAAGMSGTLKLQPGRESFVLPRSDDTGHVSRMA